MSPACDFKPVRWHCNKLPASFRYLAALAEIINRWLRPYDLDCRRRHATIGDSPCWIGGSKSKQGTIA